jgi:hypothetical protein
MSPRNPNPGPVCEYGRCGGLGAREVKKRRAARMLVRVDDRDYRVCESCADLLYRDASQRGRRVVREPLADT